MLSDSKVRESGFIRVNSIKRINPPMKNDR